MIYLDNAATTITDSKAIDVVCDVLKNNFANPSSLYKPAIDSENIMKNARGIIANCLNVQDKQIFFTACGTESNNIAILGAALPRTNWADNIVITGYEHPSVDKCAKSLERYGFKIVVINPDKNGEIDTNLIVEAVNSKTALVCAMQVNNEIGSIIDVNLLAEKIKQKNNRTVFHVDAVQGFLKIPFSLKNSKIDSLSISGHKLYAPKGVGALYLRQGHNILPPLLGGGQEGGIRPGTENIAYISAFAYCCKMLYPTVNSRLENAKQIISYLKDKLSVFDCITINSPDNACPYNFNFSVNGYKSEVLLHFLEEYNVYVSSGSACSKGKPSHTLSAMKLEKMRIDCALRISIGKDTTIQDIDVLVNAIEKAINSLARMKR